MMMKYTAPVLLFASSGFAAFQADQITSLPGWSGELPSKQYSGYLDAGNSTHLHYWLVESETNPADAPVVLWFNGGPGCSSLDGFFYEHGPFEIASDYKTLVEREYRWNSLVNMLYIEAPVGVGFSYSDDKNYKLDDDRTATENREAVEAFFNKFPEYKENAFFITGESYAGVYVPTLAEAIVQGQLDGSYTGAHLSGIAVGNGCTGTEVGICGDGPQGTYYEWSYLLGTAFVDEDLKSAINDACDWDAAAKNEKGALSAQCASLLNTASQEIGHVNLYNIYGDCVSDMCAPYGEATSPTPSKVPLHRGSGTAGLQGRIIPHGPDACIDSGAATAYLNQPEVVAATHVRDPGFCWAVCNTAPGWSYQSTRPNLPRDTYPLLIDHTRVLVYNGDWDACVPYTDNEAWTEGMGFAAARPWHAWAYTSAEGQENQVAGYAVEYDVSAATTTTPISTGGSSSGSFEFITIRGGRHEVPETAPAQALEMLRRFVGEEKF